MFSQRLVMSYEFMVRRLITPFLALVILFSIICALLPTALAHESTPSSALPSSNIQPQVPASSIQLPTSISPTSPLFTDLLVNNIFHTFSCLAIGQSMIAQPCLTYQFTQDAQGRVQGVPVLSQVDLSGGVLGGTTNLISLLYAHPPVKSSEYLASVGQSLGIVKEANAQVLGSGQAVLSPTLGFWEASRNVSYVIMIVIFVVIGLMVMFRQRINPQTVITAQAALPGLVLGLVLITFSYFFAGFVSDMAFVGTNVVGAYFSTVKGQPDKPQNLVQQISPDSILSIFSHFVGIVTRERATDAIDTVYNRLGNTAQDHLRVLAAFLAAQFVAPLGGALPPPAGLFAGPALSIMAGLGVSTAPAFFLGFLLSFIATLALIYQMLKLLLRLIASYLTIVFLTISAPFHFLIAALPGRQEIASNWFLNMLGNVLVFPAVLAVFYFIAFVLGQNFGPFTITQLNRHESNPFVANVYAQGKQTGIVDSTSFPLFGGLDLDFVRILLAFGALMALPSIPDLIVKTVGKAGQAGQILGQEIQGGIRSGQGYYGQFQGAAGSQASMWKRSLIGDTQYRVDESGTLVPWVTTPGWKQWLTYPKADTPKGKIGE